MNRVSRSAKIAGAVAVGAVVAAGAGFWLIRDPQPKSSPAVSSAAIPPASRPDPTPNTSVAPAKSVALALIPFPDAEQACSGDGAWCVSLTGPDDEGVARPILRPGPNPDSSLAPVEPTDGGETFTVWPKLVVLGEGGFIAGVETRLSTGYSGGGGSATELRLFRVVAGQTPSGPILTLPVQGDLLIRACFSEADMEKRGEACHDEYGFTGKLEIEVADGAMPALAYSTNAWAFPRGASRDEDSTTRGPLTAADLVRETDRKCSFSRRFVFDARRGAYAPDRPLPDCSNYTTP